MKTRFCKNGHSKRVAIDSVKLKHCLNTNHMTRKYTSSHISKVLGFDQAYISRCLIDNRMGEKCIQLLAEKFCIMPTDYVTNSIPVQSKLFNESKFEKSPTSDAIELKVTMNADFLKHLIKEAVKEAYEEL